MNKQELMEKLEIYKNQIGIGDSDFNKGVYAGYKACIEDMSNERITEVTE